MSRFAAAFLVAAAPAFANAAAIDVQIRNAAGMPVPDVAVYAMPASGAVEARSGHTADIEQVDREFVPYLTVLQTGTVASFPNRDPILHHVYSFSPAKSFEIKLYSGRSPSSITFDKPGIVTLGCNIHDWMIGYVLVVSTPYFAKTDPAGHARLRDLPAGSYAVHAWHPQQVAAPAPVTVSLDAGASDAVSFTTDVVARKAKYKPPLDRLKY